MKNIKNNFIWTSVFACLLSSGAGAHAQSLMSLGQAIETALSNNPGIKAAAQNVDYYKSLQKTSSDIGKFSATWMHGQYNSIYQDNNFTLSQSIPFPTALTSQSRFNKEQAIYSQATLLKAKNDLVQQVKSRYVHLQYLLALKGILMAQDSLYANFAKASETRYRSGETNLLESASAKTQSLESKNQLAQNDADIRIEETRLQNLLHTFGPIIPDAPLQKKVLLNDSALLANNPNLSAGRQLVIVGRHATRAEQNKILPDINLGYFNQSLTGFQNVNGQEKYYGSQYRFQGIQAGLSFPLWFRPNVARVRALNYKVAELKSTVELQQTALASDYQQGLQELEKFSSAITYYLESALVNARLIRDQALKASKAGDISYIEYLQALKTSMGIEMNYLLQLDLYNQTVVRIEHLFGVY